MSIDSYSTQAKSKDPATRRQAITALGKSGDAAALPILLQLYKNDPDPDLREHARKAGAYLKRSLEGGAGAPASTASAAPAAPTRKPNNQGLLFVSAEEPMQGDVVNKAPARPQPVATPSAEVIVSEKDQRRAKELVDQAMDAQVAGDNKRTVQLLGKAISINPKLEKDSRVTGLLSIATGSPANQAIEELRRIQAGGKNPKMIGGGDGSGDELGTTDFIVELLIWMVLMSLLVMGLLLAGANLVDWQEVSAQAAQQGEDPEVVSFYRDLGTTEPMVLIIAGFLIGITSIVSNVFTAIVMWFVGTFLGGEGLLFTFIQYVLRAQIGVLLVGAIGGFLGLILLPTPTNVIMAAVIFGGITVIGWFVLAWAVGKAHEFGIMMGCVNIVAAQLVCGLLQCALSFFGTAGT